MDLRLTDAERAELGLEGVELGEPVQLERTEVAGALGYAAAALELDDYVEPSGKPAWNRLARELAFRPQVRDALGPAGFDLRVSERQPRLLFVASTANEPVHVDAPGTSPGARAILADPDAPSAVVIDLARARRAVVRLPDGSGVLVDARGNEPAVVRPFRAPALDVRPAERIEAPEWLREWLGATDDTWLRSAVQSALLPGDAWAAANAVGTWARLRRVDPATARASLARMLAGEVDEEEARAARWMQSLAPRQVETLERLALVEIHALADAAETVAEAIDPEDAAWVGTLAELLHRRDELEGVRALLLDAGRGEGIGAALRSLDAALEPTVRSLPRSPALAGDERLVRVAQASPGAWWALPAVRP